MDKVRVYNRSDSVVYYTDSANNRLRMWEPIVQGIMSYKDLEYEELERVLNDYGTRKLFQEYLLIKDKKICESLDLNYDESYYYDANQIINILENGTDEELIELLQSCPQGSKDIIKEAAIELQLDSTRKRNIIKDYLGFDITFAINNDIVANKPIIKKD